MNKIIYTLLTVISLSCITVNAHAITSLGNWQCEGWVLAIKQDKYTSQNYAMMDWLQGYMSGIAKGSKKDVLKDIEIKAVITWLHIYCSDNPSSSLTDAGLKLFEILEKNKKAWTNEWHTY